MTGAKRQRRRLVPLRNETKGKSKAKAKAPAVKAASAPKVSEKALKCKSGQELKRRCTELGIRSSGSSGVLAALRSTEDPLQQDARPSACKPFGRGTDAASTMSAAEAFLLLHNFTSWSPAEHTICISVANLAQALRFLFVEAPILYQFCFYRCRWRSALTLKHVMPAASHADPKSLEFYVSWYHG